MVIFIRGEKNTSTGNFSGEVYWKFFNVRVDLRSLGLGDFQGSGEACNFKTVFSELAKLKIIPFSFASERLEKGRPDFGNLQGGQLSNSTLRAAKLYVHRRDQSDHSSDTTGVGVLLESVKVATALKSEKGYYAILTGDSANLVNF
jgi:hypothetical protein